MAFPLEDCPFDGLQPAIAGHGPVIQSQHFKCEDLLDGVGIADVERTALETAGLHQVRAGGQARRRILSRIEHDRVCDSGDKPELVISDPETGIADHAGQHVPCEEAERHPVVLCDLPQEIAGNHAAAAAHVLDNDRRISGNMLGQMLCDDATLDIGRTAGPVVDKHGDALALVELGLRTPCRNKSCCGHRNRKGLYKSSHFIPPYYWLGYRPAVNACFVFRSRTAVYKARLPAGRSSLYFFPINVPVLNGSKVGL